MLVKNGSLPHSFPDGDPVFKQFLLTITDQGCAGQCAWGGDEAVRAVTKDLAVGQIPDP